MLKDCYRFPILITLECVEVGVTTINITIVLFKCMAKYGGLLVEKLGSQWVCIGCDKNFVFQIHYIKVTSQLKYRVIPFLIGVHCMAHITSLIVIVLSKLPLVSYIEFMLWFLYSFFAHSLKKFMECCKFAKILQSKGFKFLKNVKTHRISMLSPLKCVMAEYKSLIVKMHFD